MLHLSMPMKETDCTFRISHFYCVVKEEKELLMYLVTITRTNAGEL